MLSEEDEDLQSQNTLSSLPLLNLSLTRRPE